MSRTALPPSGPAWNAAVPALSRRWDVYLEALTCLRADRTGPPERIAHVETVIAHLEAELEPVLRQREVYRQTLSALRNDRTGPPARIANVDAAIACLQALLEPGLAGRDGTGMPTGQDA